MGTSKCMRCEQRYRVTPELLMADAACPLCGEPLRKTLHEIQAEEAAAKHARTKSRNDYLYSKLRQG